MAFKHSGFLKLHLVTLRGDRNQAADLNQLHSRSASELLPSKSLCMLFFKCCVIKKYLLLFTKALGFQINFRCK